jgi:hypothetical protein
MRPNFADSGKFCFHGVAVAQASAAMKTLRLTAFLLCGPIVAYAQQWSASIASGPFVFGDFAETVEFIGPLPSRIEHSLTGDTNVGVAAGLERYFNQRFSLRLEATFTKSHLAVRSGSDEDTVSLDIADLDATTLALPFVFRFNSGGTFRPLIYAGPAYVIYDITPQLINEAVPIFSGSRKKGGWIGGGGLEWWWSDRFGARGTISDILTDSPLKRSDFPGPTPSSLEIKDVHNLHGTAGVVLRF